MQIYWKSSINHHNRTRTIKDMQILAEKREGFCISNEYINRQNPLEWQCKKGHKWKASPKNIIKGSWCRQCRCLNIDIAINIAQERGGKCLSTEYKNSNTPMLWRCIKGHEWYAPLTRIKDKKRWCAQCAGIKPCGLEACQEIAYSKGGACLSTEYKNLNVLMQWKCDKDHKWFASFNGIKHARSWCPYCLNKHENLCRDIITNILGPPSGIRRPDFLKTLEYPRGLELDIYYPQHGLAIEVQGIQHRQYRKRFHKNEKDFEKQLIRDQLKKELCEENWIVLRYVWYYEDPYIVIPEHLRELGLIK
ncbi:hypothetical protein C2G38_2230593 [Gigaspora rosea]|uniref:Zinc-ribbon domain-containing protein n=1 Tax=Gigaspora rosea TaxID=44941 RepID=A0A397TVT0_9GLOM|nr:hypothetical protein C2G38_2230593 [Gigaspora rosea]